MKTPTINSRILKLEVLKGTATRTSVNAVESRTTSLESDVATAQGDISTLQTDVSAVEGDISTLQGNVATLTQVVAGKQDSLTISDVGEAMLALATPSGQKIPRVNADGSVVLINVPSGDGVGGSSWYASDDGPPSVDISLSWVSDGDANGVVYLAGSTLGSGSFTNPSISGGPLAMLRSSDGDGNASQLTDRAPNVSYSANIQNSWICCDLGAYALGLKSYSLRHQSSYNVDHIRTWRIQGSNMVTWSIAGVEAAEWVDVDVRSNDTTISAVDAWGHWSLPQHAPSYRYIRLLQDGPNSTGRYYLTVAEWEFYGTLTGTAATRPLPAGSAGWARNSELIDDATAWMPYYATSALTDGTPIFGTAYDVASAVSAHNVAGDSHADIRTLVADRALIGHQHARTDLPWVTEPGAALLTAESASAQRTALGMTAWAVAPWTDGTTSDIPEGAQLYFTNARADARADARIAAQKGQADGIMPLDSGGKAPLAYIPDALIGQVKFKGVWDAATNSPVLPSATTSMGHYYVTSVAGSYGGIDYGVGDWCISDGTAWGKVDNSDAITSFAGRVGAILPIASDYSSFYLGLHAQADDAARLGGQLPSYYAQASHVHTFDGLTSKPTTLAGYGITDAAAASHTHSVYETAIGNPSANGYLLSSTSAGVRSWVAPYSHPATHAQSVIDSSSGWITTALAGKQAAGSYLTTTGTAADSAKLGGQAPAYYLARTNHTGTQPASTISDFAATTRATVATGMVTTTPEVALATDALLAIIGKLQAQINSDRRYDYDVQIGGGAALLIPIAANGNGTGVTTVVLYSEIENTATLTNGEFYTNNTGTTSLGKSVALSAGVTSKLYIKLPSGTDTLTVAYGWAISKFGTSYPDYFCKEVANGPKLNAFNTKYIGRFSSPYIYSSYGSVSGTTYPWLNASQIYFYGSSLTVSGTTYPWLNATQVYFSGNLLTVSGTTYPWINTTLVYFSGTSLTVSGTTYPWLNTTLVYFSGTSLTVSGTTYPWLNATQVYFDGNSLTVSGTTYPWINATRVLFYGNSLTVSANLSSSCLYIGTAGLDIYLSGTGISVSYPTSRTWPTVLNRIYLRPASGTMPSADVDRLCIDLATYTTSATGNKVLDLRGNCGAATSASATARAYLAGLGISVSVNT